MRQIQRLATFHSAEFGGICHRACVTPLLRNGARCVGRLLQHRQTDVIGIGKRCFIAGHRTYTHTLINIKTARLNLAFFQPPAFGATVLKIQIGEIHLTRHDLIQHLLQLRCIQPIGRKQAGLSRMQH